MIFPFPVLECLVVFVVVFLIGFLSAKGKSSPTSPLQGMAGK
jgi:hypothetical protein